MSLKAVEIDPFLLAGIYRLPLVPPAREEQKADEETQTVPFLGGNRQQILLVIDQPGQAFLTDEIFDMLTRLLEACGLTMEDVALVNAARLQEREAGRLPQQFKPHKVILFGASLPGLGGKKGRNQIWEEGGMEMLATDSLEAMYRDKDLKVPFWVALKRFFHL